MTEDEEFLIKSRYFKFFLYKNLPIDTLSTMSNDPGPSPSKECPDNHIFLVPSIPSLRKPIKKRPVPAQRSLSPLPSTSTGSLAAPLRSSTPNLQESLSKAAPGTQNSSKTTLNGVSSKKSSNPQRVMTSTTTQGASRGTRTTSTITSKELRREYNQLIESCQELEGRDELSEADLLGNIEAGGRLFRSIGGSPGDMLISFLHTRNTAQMIRARAEVIGDNSGFRIDNFVQALKEMIGENPDLDMTSEERTVRFLSYEGGFCLKSAPHLVFLAGAFDLEDLTRSRPKVKAIRAKRTEYQGQMGEGSATKIREISSRDELCESTGISESIENESKLMLKSIEERCNSMPDGINLLDFAINPIDGVNGSIRNLFHTGFLVKEGHLAVSSKEGKSGPSSLTIKPRAKKIDKKMEKIDRSQVIVSINGADFKRMIEKARAKRNVLGMMPNPEDQN